MNLPPLTSIPLILRPQAWLHRRHYGAVLSPIRWWGRIPLAFYLVSMFVGYLERRRSPLDPLLRSLVSARIAQLCHCEFCIDITSMKLAQQFDAQALTELTALIGLQNLSARFNSALAIPAQGLCQIPKPDVSDTHP
ncbi:carboxymuconolactone decarboxylase family protein [Klebsiella aerogenes]|uniref:carboxymuconolactone decarboxylase family protein n=1 Tax=Klebsiella aerogenes TaxID=548 RepID=UPI0005F06B1A|nr:carboxymuconolactone decarboxylase family protein [Klebsiella aerogenes]KJO44764.1 hypothetical protein SR83_09460 [Klebsiella aerogenes]KJO51128.1 hypothetical protein SR82_03315 [Klebsiella aerogenes]KJO53887.1 hypothetical protein SR85_03865 [Klebsiella aerogenes]